MQLSNLLTFGGTGFIGSQLLSRLVTETSSVPGLPEGRMIVPTCDPESARAHDFTLLPRVDVMDADTYADDALDALFLALTECGVEYYAIINLVDVLQDTREMPYGPNFQRVHVDLPRRIVAACRRHGVNRLLHISTLGADPAGPSMYLRSKGDGKRVVMNSEFDWMVLRPSVVFGPQDHFPNLFASVQRMASLVPLVCADARLQPAYVDDVAVAFINVLKEPATIRHIYSLVGPRVYTLAEPMRFVEHASGHPRWIVPLPEGLDRTQAALLEHPPGAPISRDDPDSMRVDNVSMEPVVPELGIYPLGMGVVMLPALADSGPDRELCAARMRVHRQPPRRRGAFALFVNVFHNRGQCVSFCGGAA